jgi:hypothetical protein
LIPRRAQSVLLNQIGNPPLEAGQALDGNWLHPNHLFSSRQMTLIPYLNRSSSDPEPVRLCRRKAMECQRTAMTTTNSEIRLRFFQLARLWSEMGDEAEQRTIVSSSSKQPGTVLSLSQFQKSG